MLLLSENNSIFSGSDYDGYDSGLSGWLQQLLLGNNSIFTGANNDGYSSSFSQWRTDTICDGFTVSLGNDTTLCTGDNIQLNPAITGGTAPYTYLWNTGSTDAPWGVPAGNYSVIITDNSGCTATDSINIGQISINLSAVITNASGGNNGSINLSVSGGTVPYTYLWNNGSTTQDIMNLAAGNYNVTVTDANGCSATSSWAVSTIGCNLTTMTTHTDAICFGMNNGSITLFTSGGTAPFTYTWSNGSTTQNVSNLLAGTYKVTVTGAGGCIATETVTITQPTAIVVSFSKTDASCGVANGSASANPTGGSGVYTYEWSNTEVTQGVFSLSAGIYTVTVTDDNACTGTGSVVINETGAPTIELQTNNISCFGAADGSIIANVTGGATPYTYNWSNGETTNNNQPLTSNSYILTVTDNNNCMALAATYISEPTQLVMVYTVQDEVQGNDGSIQVLVSGGTAPYTYSWSNGATTNNQQQLTANTYYLTVTDANGCTLTNSMTINGSSCAISLSFNPTDVLCYGQSYGSIDLTVSNAADPVSYLWSNNQSSEDLINYPAGTYGVTVTDNMGCTAAGSSAINQPAVLVVEVMETAANCGEEDGSVEAMVSGGSSPYNYAWSTGSDSTIIIDLSSGYYMLTVTDDNGCQEIAVAFVNDASTLSVSLNSITDITCNGSATGAIDINVTGGGTPYTYEWSNGATTASLNGLTAGVYDVQVTDDYGCVVAESYEVTEPDAAVITVVTSPANCGASTGSATAIVTGGTAPFNYLWSTGETTDTITDLAVGTYSLVVTDANMCMKMKMFSISNDNGPVLSSVGITETVCDDSTGSIDINISGGSMPFTYLWSTGDTTEDLSGLSEDTYSITISDENGCVTAGTYTLTTQLPLENPICMVFVDSLSGNNVVVWEKVQEEGVSHYNIYRENNMAGVFQLLGTVPYNDMSLYEDFYADPVTRPWKYKISAVDSCGNESPLSEEHKTLHLTINQGLNQTVNLIWDSYQGFPYYSFFVWRHTNQTGWEIIDTIPSTVWTYVDDPGNQGQLYYLVSVVHEDSCVTTGGSKAVGGPYSHSTSNIDETVIEVSVEALKANIDFDLLIYPNPSNSSVYVEFKNEHNKVYTMHMYNVAGELVKQLSDINTSKFSFEKGNLAPGFYTIELTGEKTMRGKVLIR